MFTFFFFSGIWFWLFILFVFLTVTFYIERNENETDGITVTIVLFLLCLLYFISNHNALIVFTDYLLNNPVKIILFILLYLSCGIVWSILQWMRIVKNAKKKYLEKIKQTNNPSGVNKDVFIPQVSHHTDALTVWIAYWPLSLFRWLIGNAIFKLFTNIIKALTVVYNERTIKAFKDL